MEGYRFEFGEYKGWDVYDVPMSYLLWLFPKARTRPKYLRAFEGMLERFLDRDVRVEERGNTHQFFFDDYFYPAYGGGEAPFLETPWKMEDSLGRPVYEIETVREPLFVFSGGKLELAKNRYKSFQYDVFHRIAFEVNDSYVFYDKAGKVFNGFLMKKYGDEDRMFSKNIKVGG